MAASASQIVRDALREWALGLVADVLPASTVEGGVLEAGKAPDLPTLGIEWGATDVVDSHPYDITEEADLDTGAGVWHVHDEDVQLAFVWRATTPEDADLFAHEFATRAAIEAAKSNDEGSRVLHFDVTIGDAMRTAKLYLGGGVQPVRQDDNATRSLYTFRVPGSVVYPVIRVESDSDATGLMNVVIVDINDTSFPLADIVE